MFGQSSQCRSCDFQFSSGHSHHVGYSPALCVACLTQFTLPTANPWGPNNQELIVLHKAIPKVVYRHKKKPPDISWHFEPTDEFLIAQQNEQGGIEYPLSHMRCPSCALVGTIVADFTNGAPCQKCKTGVLECSEIQF